uniref:CCHC-type domain-containing protein n=1 Tax=Trichuris muris TaxID=70415 RepID=A0A5S6R6A0_TRIMR
MRQLHRIADPRWISAMCVPYDAPSKTYIYGGIASARRSRYSSCVCCSLYISPNKLDYCFELVMPRAEATSYRGPEPCRVDRLLMDMQLIPVFDGSVKSSIMDWLEKVELVCKLRGIDDMATVIPLRLAGGAFATYMQMPSEDRMNAMKIKDALTTAFAADAHVAYEQFVSRKLKPGEQPDLFLAELRGIATLLGGVSEKVLACAFVAGLPAGVRQLLRAGCRIEEMNLNQILARARAVLADELHPGSCHEACLGIVESKAKQRPVRSGRKCFSCGGIGHFARECPDSRQTRSNSIRETDQGSRIRARNRNPHGAGAAVAVHQGNDYGEKALAPACSPHGH